MFYGHFMFQLKSFKKWEKNNPSSACPCRIEKFHLRGQNFTRGSAILVPGRNSNPSDEIKSILHMYCCGTRKSHPRTRIIRQKRGSDEIIQVRGWDFLVPQQYIMMDTCSRPVCDFLRFYMNSVSSVYFFRLFAFVPI